MIKSFCRTKRMERAFDFLSEKKLKGFPVNLKDYANLVFGCARTDFVMSGLRLMREIKLSGLPLKPYYHFVIQFRRNLTQSPHIVREIDELTGKAREYLPGWKRVGGRKPKPEWREVPESERKMIATEPKWLTAYDLDKTLGPL
eukprot:TRINITY_DN1196_c0_g1_i11.p1 TRINITY_DN1196_c0_g1~~TRINITY_DN1196_c0_g1_i11.p1  ORF type:complete len:144 (-),score=27.83 TRINITY_DN1196_c0_g1_i11:57-488(-)